MDKPKVDAIRGIPPAIAIEQSNPVKTTRSTVGTITEISDRRSGRGTCTVGGKAAVEACAVRSVGYL